MGIDFGGGSSKATLLSEEGEIVATSTAEYPTYYESVGASEQDPDDWNSVMKFSVLLFTDPKLCSSDGNDIFMYRPAFSGVLLPKSSLAPCRLWLPSERLKAKINLSL